MASKTAKRPPRVNQRNYKPSKGEIPYGETLTVPDATLGLQEMLERHTRGQGITTFLPNYTTEEEVALGLDLHEIKKMDTFQKLEMSRDIRGKLEKIRDKVAADEKEQKAKERQEEIQAAANKLIEENKKKENAS